MIASRSSVVVVVTASKEGEASCLSVPCPAWQLGLLLVALARDLAPPPWSITVCTCLDQGSETRPGDLPPLRGAKELSRRELKRARVSCRPHISPTCAVRSSADVCFSSRFVSFVSVPT
jgi:hypothetical protein